jgi:N-acetylmuramoyl-L-alanine amidase
MKFDLKGLFIVLIFSATCLFSKPSSAYTVLIDPGHGGSDAGARHGSIKESEIALKVSLMLAELLRKDPTFKVLMTRDRDEKLTLEQRAQKAKEIKPDLFISIHLNSSADPRAHGREFYFQNQLPADEEAMFLVSRENSEGEIAEGASNDRLSAETDVKRILEDLKRNHRIRESSEFSKTLLEAWLADGQSRRIGSLPIRQAPFYVVSNVPSPSVLVELGFITHATEGPRLAQSDYQQLLARSIYEGLVKYKDSVDKGPARLLQSAQQADPKVESVKPE